MKKFAVTVQWSQTDSETYIVNASDRKAAEKATHKALPGIHHVSGVREIAGEI